MSEYSDRRPGATNFQKITNMKKGVDFYGKVCYHIITEREEKEMTKKEIVNELEKYTTLIPNRQAFEKMQKVHLENLLKDFQKKVDNIA